MPFVNAHRACLQAPRILHHASSQPLLEFPEQPGASVSRPGDATMLNDLKELLASLSGGRPLVVALLVIAICFLLLRPRRKQPSPPAAAAGAGSSGAAGAPQQKLPALSLSTCDILLEFVNGAPRLKQERRARTRRRPG